jgi:hypothetical protein
MASSSYFLSKPGIILNLEQLLIRTTILCFFNICTNYFMNRLQPTLPIVLIFCSFLLACSSSKKIVTTNKYIPDSQSLYDTIVKWDSIYFTAYNTCDLDKQRSIFSDSLEFYHDKGGLSTSKSDIMAALQKNICGKVTRELVAGSIEVYPIKDFGAVEMGIHHFHNNQEPAGTPSHPGKFVIIWQHLNNTWKIKRVVSLH